MLCLTADSNSIRFIPTAPSPLIRTTCLLGKATLDPIAKGTPTPIQPRGPPFT